MSKIKNEIERCIEELSDSGVSVSARFMFPGDFLGFQGHFPTTKVLPGACQIQCVLSALEKASGKEVALREILLAKYVATIVPGDSVVCNLNCADNGAGESLVKARIAKGEEKVTELRLLVSLSDRA